MLARPRRNLLTPRCSPSSSRSSPSRVGTTGAVQAYVWYQDTRRSLFRLQREKAKSLATAIDSLFSRESQRLLDELGKGSTFVFMLPVVADR